MAKVTLGVNSEREIIESDLLLLVLECQQERRCLSRTLLTSPGQRQPRSFPVKRTHHDAYTGCLEQESGPSPSNVSWHEECASVRTARKRRICGTWQCSHKAWPSLSHANCTPTFTKQHSHNCESSSTAPEAVFALVAL